jgi:hypothetical protein
MPPPDTRSAAEAAIVARPDAWPIIQGTGGARVIYCFSADEIREPSRAAGRLA